MARSGDDTSADAVSRLSGRLDRAEERLRKLESTEPAKLKQQLGELTRERAAQRGRQKEAADKTALVAGQIKALDVILTSILADPPVTFDDLRADQDKPAPELTEPKPPGLSRYLRPGVAGRHEEAQQRARERHSIARADHVREMEQAAQRNADVEERRAAFAAQDPAAVEWFISEVLRRSQYPKTFPRQYQVSYNPEHAAVVADVELPAPEIVPREDGYQAHPDRIWPVSRPGSAIRQQYKRLIACIALRTLHEIFAATSPYPGTVRAVTITGWAAGREEAVGESCTARLLAVSAGRDAFAGLQLADVQPAQCLTRTLGGQMSPYPYGLVPAADTQAPDRH